MAHLAVGERDTAEHAVRLGPAVPRARRPLLDRHRVPRGVHFPGGEQSTYTAAAGRAGRRRPRRRSPASGLFVDHDATPPLLSTPG